MRIGRGMRWGGKGGGYRTLLILTRLKRTTSRTLTNKQTKTTTKNNNNKNKKSSIYTFGEYFSEIKIQLRTLLRYVVIVATSGFIFYFKSFFSLLFSCLSVTLAG